MSVRTWFEDQYTIHQQVVLDHVELWHNILRLSEEQAREALIRLGWRPPDEQA